MPMSAATTTAPDRSLRRLALKLVLLVVAKIAVLTLIWWIAIAPHPRPDTSPAAVARQLAPSSTPTREAHP
jgi:hypothetical protein